MRGIAGGTAKRAVERFPNYTYFLTQKENIISEDIVLDDIGEGLETAYSENLVKIHDGQVVRGKVVRIEPHETLIDIGYKSEGVIPLKELAVRQDLPPQDIVSMGEEIEAVVLQREDREGRLVLSKRRAQHEKIWQEIEETYNAQKPIKGVAIEVVKGGLIVDIGMRGFLPASLIDLRRVTTLDEFLGEEVEAKILEMDRNRNNVVLSRRAFLEESHKEEREEIMGRMLPGEIKKGVISSVVAFGAFVDLGGMDGLIHVSEISWKHIDHPSDVVSVGDEVEVRVLGVDAERERIALSLKATQQGPWENFAETHNVGELVYGKVTKLVPFGAFIQVGDNIEGLAHISELSNYRIESPEEVIAPEEELWVKIVEIDVSKRRIGLSVKQAQEGGEVSVEFQEDFGSHTYENENSEDALMPEADAESMTAEASVPEEALATEETPEGADQDTGEDIAEENAEDADEKEKEEKEESKEEEQNG